MMMTLILFGLGFILHLAHYFANFRRSLRKSFAADCTPLVAANNAVSSETSDLEYLSVATFNPIQAGVFWDHISWEAHCAPSVSPLFVVQLQPNLAC